MHFWIAGKKGNFFRSQPSEYLSSVGYEKLQQIQIISVLKKIVKYDTKNYIGPQNCPQFD